MFDLRKYVEDHLKDLYDRGDSQVAMMEMVLSSIEYKYPDAVRKRVKEMQAAGASKDSILRYMVDTKLAWARKYAKRMNFVSNYSGRDGGLGEEGSINPGPVGTSGSGLRLVGMEGEGSQYPPLKDNSDSCQENADSFLRTLANSNFPGLCAGNVTGDREMRPTYAKSIGNRVDDCMPLKRRPDRRGSGDRAGLHRVVQNVRLGGETRKSP